MAAPKNGFERSTSGIWSRRFSPNPGRGNAAAGEVVAKVEKSNAYGGWLLGYRVHGDGTGWQVACEGGELRPADQTRRLRPLVFSTADRATAYGAGMLAAHALGLFFTAAKPAEDDAPAREVTYTVRRVSTVGAREERPTSFGTFTASPADPVTPFIGWLERHGIETENPNVRFELRGGVVTCSGILGPVWRARPAETDDAPADNDARQGIDRACPACAAQSESGPWPDHSPGCPDAPETAAPQDGVRELGTDVLRSIVRQGRADGRWGTAQDAAVSELERRGEGAYAVKRHSGTEDGWLWYVVNADGTDVPDAGGWVHESDAMAMADDVNALAELEPAAREAVQYMRSCTPAPGDYAVAIMHEGTATQYIQNQPADRNQEYTRAERKRVLGIALADIRANGWTDAYVVDIAAETTHAPTLATIRADLTVIADGMREVMAGEGGADAAAYVERARTDLAELVGMLTDEERQDLTDDTLKLCGYTRVYGRVVASQDALGYTYASGQRVWTDDKLSAVAKYAREWAADCQWADVDDPQTFRDLSDTTIVTLAAAQYVGGLDTLAEDADVAELRGHAPYRAGMPCETTSATLAASCTCGDPSDCQECTQPLPAEPGAFGPAIDASAARIAREAAETWQATGDRDEDIRQVGDILADLPSADVVRFLARVARAEPWQAVNHYGAGILDALAGLPAPGECPNQCPLCGETSRGCRCE